MEKDISCGIVMHPSVYDAKMIMYYQGSFSPRLYTFGYVLCVVLAVGRMEPQLQNSWDAGDRGAEDEAQFYRGIEMPLTAGTLHHDPLHQEMRRRAGIHCPCLHFSTK